MLLLHVNHNASTTYLLDGFGHIIEQDDIVFASSIVMAEHKPFTCLTLSSSNMALSLPVAFCHSLAWTLRWLSIAAKREINRSSWINACQPGEKFFPPFHTKANYFEICFYKSVKKPTNQTSYGAFLWTSFLAWRLYPAITWPLSTFITLFHGGGD